MLAQPPIFAPLEPVVFPPPSTSSASPAPLPFPTGTAPVTAPSRLRGSHRHARAARDALDLVQRLGDQVDGRGGGGELDSEGDDLDSSDAEQVRPFFSQRALTRPTRPSGRPAVSRSIP